MIMDTSLKNNDGALEADNKNYQDYKAEPDKTSDVLDVTKYNSVVDCCHKNYSTFTSEWYINEKNIMMFQKDQKKQLCIDAQYYKI